VTVAYWIVRFGVIPVHLTGGDRQITLNVALLVIAAVSLVGDHVAVTSRSGCGPPRVYRYDGL
jgi:hypothetical protein